MKWQTSISKVTDDGAVIRGSSLSDLVNALSFTEMIFFIFTGRFPKKSERDVLDALFVSSVDHGIQVPSVMAARIVQSAGNSLNAAVAAGVLAIGDHHGGAVEGAAKFFQENVGVSATTAVASALASGVRLGGFGHKKYERDPRVDPLFELAKKSKVSGKFVKFALDVDAALTAAKGRPLHLNIDGAMAALLCEMGVPWQAARAFFIIPRTVGIAAHAVEERMSGMVYRREDDANIEYTGSQSK